MARISAGPTEARSVWNNGRQEVVDHRASSAFSALLEPEPDRELDENCGEIAQALGTLLGEVQVLDPEERFEELVRAVKAMVDRERVRTLKALLSYLWASARSPWDVMKNALAVTRRVRPELVKGASQTEVAWLLEETRAAVHARERRVVEELLLRWGARGFKLLGGARSDESRQKCRERAKGNNNRKGGKLAREKQNNGKNEKA